MKVRNLGSVIESIGKIIHSFLRIRVRKLRFWVIVTFTSLLFIVLAQLYTSPAARSQILNLPEALQKQQTFDSSREGNLDVAKVRLDGTVLFSVGAPTPDDPSSSNSTSPIERRVKTIEFHLSDIVKRGFDPDTLKITESTLNNQTILVASDKDWGPRNILTVTAFDVELDEPGTIDEIAQRWSEVIEQALLQAHQQRQLAYQKQQIPFVLAIFTTSLVASFIIRRIQKFREVRRQRLERLQLELEATGPNASQPISSSTPADEAPLQPLQEQRSSGLSHYLPQLTLDQQIRINLRIRPLLFAAHVVIWFGGMAIIFQRFPQTRAWGEWLLRVPLAYITIPLGMAILKLVVDSSLRWYLRRIVDQIQEQGSGNVRLRSRTLSTLSVLEELTRSFAIVFGFLLFFYVINALYIALIAIAAVAFLSQNTLQNFLQTYFILYEDQYALGDWIQIGDVKGKVEKISLRATQVRTRWGDLLTISHGSFSEVTNFTHGYSGINLLIDVAYSTDLDQAIAVIEQVAKEMQQDSVWGQYITVSNMKGVETFGDNSITIGLVIMTEAGKQWDVGREYRRRLKPVFDRAGISIPFPQRSIWFENGLTTTPNGMNSR
jgi:small conductance mechanosensitive channel